MKKIMKKIQKVFIVGSGPIVIGQSVEFDYSGTQACKALRQEGIEVVLLNNNPATIMTDSNIADKIYIEPLNIDSITKILAIEKPDAILPTCGGQIALNLATELHEHGILEKYHVQLIGVNVATIKMAENREEFKQLMHLINEPVPESGIASNLTECIVLAEKIGFPVIIRPAYTLGGSGGGIANNLIELKEIASSGLNQSSINQVLIEKSIYGWKELEYEIIRDANDTTCCICNIENLDPVGVHTGDSIVVAPSQTISDKIHQKLRSAAIKIVRTLKITGACNVQFGLNPSTYEYIVIEVNPRVSRSSALASKATGYPIAKITAQIAIGKTLDKIVNPITQKTFASFEPAMDYVVVKVPAFAFDKFHDSPNILGSQMSATGEYMGIDRTFEGALKKGLQKISNKLMVKISQMKTEALLEEIKILKHDYIYYILELLKRKVLINDISKITHIDEWFILKLKNLINYENINSNKYKYIDTCAGEFDALTSYIYSTHKGENEIHEPLSSKSVIIIGSSANIIGQGVEFDYASVNAIKALQKLGYKAIMINNNPGTVSTDFDVADRLYFDEITVQSVYNVYQNENAIGVISQCGGQTALNLTQDLEKLGVKILGTDATNINLIENRIAFNQTLKELGILQPKEYIFKNKEDVLKAEIKNFPVIARPSYVIGGNDMKIIHSKQELSEYLKNIHQTNEIFIDEFIKGIEIEIDAVSNGEDVFIPMISEHIEGSGVHSGDSCVIFPAISVNSCIQQKIKDYTEIICKKFKIIGLINIQCIIKENEVYIIEANPRASRTIPIINKISNLNMIEIAINAIMDSNFDINTLNSNPLYYGVKMPIFPFTKFKNPNYFLSPQMKSTGEILGIGVDYKEALTKAFTSTGVDYQCKRIIIDGVFDNNSILKKLLKFDWKIENINKHNEKENFINEKAIFVDLTNDHNFGIGKYLLKIGKMPIVHLDTFNALLESIIFYESKLHRNVYRIS